MSHVDDLKALKSQLESLSESALIKDADERVREAQDEVKAAKTETEQANRLRDKAVDDVTRAHGDVQAARAEAARLQKKLDDIVRLGSE